MIKLIKIIKTALKSVKLTKKASILALIYEASHLIVAALSKQYKFMTPLLKFLRVLRIWTITTGVFSLIYGSLAELFNFTYDYRFIIGLLFGIGLLIKEFVYEYYFDIHNWIQNLLERITNKLQRKVIETKNTGPVINQNTVEKVRNLTEKPIEVNNTTNLNRKWLEEAMNSPHNPIKTYYNPIKEYSMWRDWEFYATAILIAATIYVIGVELDYLPSAKPAITSSWDYVKTHSYDLYTNIKSWFTRGGGGNPPAAPSVGGPSIKDNVASGSGLTPDDFKGKGKVTEHIQLLKHK